MNRFILLMAATGVMLAACESDRGGPAPVNVAPTISAVADLSITANRTSPAIGFTVNDERPDSLTIVATSDRQQLLPDTGLVIGGSGSTRSLAATPVIDELGDALITIVVTDTAGLSASTAFLLTVDPEQKSMQQFARDAFAADANDEPALINAVEFAQDAEEDDFADLLVD